jgi:hypothetical protein
VKVVELVECGIERGCAIWHEEGYDLGEGVEGGVAGHFEMILVCLLEYFWQKPIKRGYFNGEIVEDFGSDGRYGSGSRGFKG